MNVDNIQRTISVTGVGRAAAPADILLLDLAVETQAATASEALAENNRQTAAVLSALRDQGIQERDIQTNQLSINPVFARQDPDDTSTPTITGYQARNGLSVRLRDLQGAGAVIDAAVQAGGDSIRIDGISFSFTDSSGLLVEARKRAIEDGKARAQQLADGFGVGLGNITSISESDFSGQRQFRDFAAVSLAATSISPGESEVALQVTVDYEISTQYA
ncbi:MAG: SIMPL domain-containing protein [Pseudonocardiaceae bacterium]